MNTYTTTIMAICPTTGELKTYAGPNVPGITEKDAEDYLQMKGLGYCRLSGILISEIPCKPGTLRPDWERRVDFEENRTN